MKTKRILLQSIVLLLFVHYFNDIKANEPILTEKSTYELNPYSINSSDVKLKVVNIQFDALGFIFAGPQLGLDFQIADIVAIGPYARWNYAGLLYQAGITSWFSEETTVSVASYGIGVGAKIIPPIGSGRHRPYIDLGFEKFNGKEYSDPGGTWGKHYYQYKVNIFHFGAGYRMITEGSFNLSVGFYIAIAKETENYDYYEFNDEKDYNSLEDPYIVPGLQLLLGWQFGG